MICKKCGNEIKDGEQFCSKCGNKIEEPDIINKKEIDMNKIRKKTIIICSVIIVFFIILLIFVMFPTNSNNSNNSNNSISTQENNSNLETTTEKQYYDFIDVDYGTFNITEEECIKNIMTITGGNSSYQAQGYKRDKSTTNGYIYGKVFANGSFHSITITNNPENGKVSKIRLYVAFARIPEEEVEDNLYNMMCNIIAGIIGLTDLNDNEKIQEGKTLAEEILDGIAPNKGLITTTKYEEMSSSYDLEVEMQVRL